eukprot:CAMPEP_0181321054 /NCGR_PEP_ID=MMETSP1101-20121128/18464_1 /TAXON_ID=46948 /ORGANISM="Rhodomonas abbreviata, Strain Caron Lab Isolate" /LENGTH=73 /DNA_ID=CAMNT_0023428823 /DNA_START=188 /DNA_END=409 /DNA_ORIENTATION=+
MALDWGSDDEVSAQDDRNMEQKKNETTALLAEFQKARSMDNREDRGVKRQQKANLGELVGNEDENKCCECSIQ